MTANKANRALTRWQILQMAIRDHCTSLTAARRQTFAYWNCQQRNKPGRKETNEKWKKRKQKDDNQRWKSSWDVCEGTTGEGLKPPTGPSRDIYLLKALLRPRVARLLLAKSSRPPGPIAEPSGRPFDGAHVSTRTTRNMPVQFNHLPRYAN